MSNDRKMESMSLRDYFAARAVAGLIAGGMGPNSAYANYDLGGNRSIVTGSQEFAARAYMVADAMLAERLK